MLRQWGREISRVESRFPVARSRNGRPDAMKQFRTRLAAKTPFSFLCFWIIGGLLNSWVAGQENAGEPSVYQVGMARFDVTPEYPIRLNGFGNRRQESEGVGQGIWAKALAIS